jgi:transposase InsO family protein
MHPVPDVQQLFDALGPHNAFYATIDLRLGYHHVALSAAAKLRTAFSTPCGLYQFRVLPFGLKSAPRVFQHIMSTILAEHLWTKCLVYLDDVVVFGVDFPTFLNNLDQVMGTLATAGAAFSIDKCKFLAEEVQYLGHVITRDSCKPDPTTTRVIQDYPKPTTKRELLRFIGLGSYIRKFVSHFARLEQQLRAIVPPDNQPLKWTTAAEQAFTDTKAAIVSDVALRRFDPHLHTEIHCDASQTSMGATLLQGTTPDTLYPLEYASSTLSTAERNYKNLERELLCIEWAVTKKFRVYVEGRSVVVGTDCEPLIHEIKLKEPSRRIVRMLLRLAPFDYILRHIPGEQNKVSDALSRIPCVALCQTRQSVPNTSQQTQLIWQYHHDFGHANWKTTLQGLQQRFSWPRMRHTVWSTLHTCKECQRFTAPTVSVGMQLEPVHTTRPNELWCMDVIPMPRTRNSNDSILLVVDHFSKMAFVKATQATTTPTITFFLRQLLTQLPKPLQIVTDPGPQFCSNLFAAFLHHHGIAHRTAGKRHFEGNGCCERMVRTLSEILAKLSLHPAAWDEALFATINAYNNRPHSSTGAEPAAIYFQSPCRTNTDMRLGVMGPMPPSSAAVRQHLVTMGRGAVRTYNKRHRARFRPGDIVFHVPRIPTTQRHAKSRRFRPRKFGPYCLTRYLGDARYLASDGSTSLTLPAWELIPSPASPFSDPPRVRE